MNKMDFFKRFLRAIIMWFNRNLYELCKLITRIMKAITIQSERMYTGRKYWKNY